MTRVELLGEPPVACLEPGEPSRQRVDPDGRDVSPQWAYAEALRGARCRIHMAGRQSTLLIERWLGEPDATDVAMLAECRGSTLDVGCGPGRMTVGLLDRGHPALGVDPVAEAVRMARRRGAPAVIRSVFEPVPAEGRWDTVLLADGNIGIGGDPKRLLQRATRLLGDGGRVVAEVRRPGLPHTTHAVRLEVHGVMSGAFAWATVAADRLALLAESVALRLLGVRDFGGRWVATMEKDRSCC